MSHVPTPESYVRDWSQPVTADCPRCAGHTLRGALCGAAAVISGYVLVMLLRMVL